MCAPPSRPLAHPSDRWTTDESSRDDEPRHSERDPPWSDAFCPDIVHFARAGAVSPTQKESVDGGTALVTAWATSRRETHDD